MPATTSCSASTALPLFYMYTNPGLDHHFLRSCRAYNSLRMASKAENTAEVGLRHALAHHPLRTRDPEAASLFYVPIWEYTSNFVNECVNASTKMPDGMQSHRQRMAAAHAALLASPFFRRHGGRDHFWASTAFSAHGYSLSARMAPLSSLLGCSAVGRYKAGPFTRFSAVGSCVVEVPYQASLHVMHAWVQQASGAGGGGGGGGGEGEPDDSSMDGNTPRRRPGTRPTLLFFAGSLDVCCTGKALRCAIGELHYAALGMQDVTIRPTGPGVCTRRALERAANFSSGGSGGTSSRSDDGSAAPTASGRYVSMGVVERTAQEMTRSLFCLCPAGDTCVTSRTYSAIAAGCLPVVLCDQLQGAFSGAVDYSSFWLKWPTKSFLQHPQRLLSALRDLAANTTELARRQAAMDAARADVLYDEPSSRVGTRFIEAIVRKCPIPGAHCRQHNETARDQNCFQRLHLDLG